MNFENKIKMLYSKNAKEAYSILLELEKISEINDVLYCYLDEFTKMIIDVNSYIRTRGYRLFCKQAKWDKLNKINDKIEEILKSIEDEKPIAVRQKIIALTDVVKYKKELNKIIKQRISCMNLLKYKDSMQELIRNDIKNLINSMST